MMRIFRRAFPALLALAFTLAFLPAALAAPANQWTVDANTTACIFTLDAAAPVVVPASAGKCAGDVASVSVGSHSTTMKARIVDPIWGNQDSAASAPFPFTRPGPPAVPTSPTLIP